MFILRRTEIFAPMMSTLETFYFTYDPVAKSLALLVFVKRTYPEEAADPCNLMYT